MLKIDILTLFPEMFAPLSASIIKRAAAQGVVDIAVTNIRDFTQDKHHTTDDRLYGGGAGMVMKPEPLCAAIRAVVLAAKPRILITSPAGRVYDQAYAEELAQAEQIIIVCGHYEGIDERVIESFDCEPVSLGDFVLTGGETAAIAIADSVTRLLPGALGDAASIEEESFAEGLLEYPQYTRPPVFEGREVPQVLQNGNHAAIAKWRREQSLLRTLDNRPELLAKAQLTAEDADYLGRLKDSRVKPFGLFVALLHYPVYNKKHEIINTSLTNLDLHDIARAGRTFGVEKYFIVQPVQSQRELIGKLLEHWRDGFGARYNPDRQQALARVSLQPYLEDALAEMEREYGSKPYLIATSAKPAADSRGFDEMRRIMAEQGGNYLLLLGTGWGLTDQLMDEADYRLKPVYGAGEYNHLSVRSAASIMFDRLLGRDM